MKSVIIKDIADEKLFLTSVEGYQSFILSEIEEYQEKFYQHKTLRHPHLEEIPASFMQYYVGYLITYLHNKVFRQKVFLLQRDDTNIDLIQMVSLKELERDFELMERDW